MGEYGIPGRRYFRKDDADCNRTHQIHAFQTGSPQIERHLAFRDYLRSHPAEAEEYDRLKAHCRDRHPSDHLDYGECKSSWIQRVESEALRAFGLA